ncbi:Glycine-rich domain-containing protein-like [Arabidopsis thaliana x Arabidopsis arenosa]|uniref:Glycine-rich domain-containing protein-like n=2 Tax=Arabidopsis TaxID=3701 RepID=A0A8T2A474_ARASU|nr:Glycine-rich domain-containing protein-like [Arabidopsis suecica]KAG7566459.1 Glycine-rich domain-containing protein-like [Arabidopsis suecica]KAG7576003.1 Glycine-rich domain-containing protein-like [Arabidopsis thaliana x Arabidopsis arenosa]
MILFQLSRDKAHFTTRAHVDNDVFLQEAVAIYKAFLYLIKIKRERSIKFFRVPTYDIDLIWHTHQLHALSYCNDLTKMIGKVNLKRLRQSYRVLEL